MQMPQESPPCLCIPGIVSLCLNIPFLSFPFPGVERQKILPNHGISPAVDMCDVAAATCRAVKQLEDAVKASLPDHPVKRQLVWDRFMKRKEVQALRQQQHAVQPDQEAQLGMSILAALKGALAQLDYKSTGRTRAGLAARNIILAAVVDLKDLQAKRLITAFADSLCLPTRAIHRAGQRRAHLTHDWFKFNRCVFCCLCCRDWLHY